MKVTHKDYRIHIDLTYDESIDLKVALFFLVYMMDGKNKNRYRNVPRDLALLLREAQLQFIKKRRSLSIARKPKVERDLEAFTETLKKRPLGNDRRKKK